MRTTSGFRLRALTPARRLKFKSTRPEHPIQGNLIETCPYGAANRLTNKTDRKGQAIQYVYDALNRLTQKTYPDSTSVEYAYDLVGKVTQVNDPTGTYGFSYDNMGRLAGTTTQYAFLLGTTFTNAYSYDAASNRTGYTAPDGSTNTYSYDTLNRLATLANSWAGSFGFSYDARGNRTSKADQLPGVTTSYGYDAIYQLLSATQGGSTTENYSYDPVGNRLSSLGVSPYSINSSNELTSTPSTSYSYDNNGNTMSKTDSTGTTNYSWDFENRLTQCSLLEIGVAFTYTLPQHLVKKPTAEFDVEKRPRTKTPVWRERPPALHLGGKADQSTVSLRPNRSRSAIESVERLVFGPKWTQVQSPAQVGTTRVN